MIARKSLERYGDCKASPNPFETSRFRRNHWTYVENDTDREKRASFDCQASATDSVSFLGLFPPKANKTVFFFVSFFQEATQTGILILVSIAAIFWGWFI